jgi:hypothetical protein
MDESVKPPDVAEIRIAIKALTWCAMAKARLPDAAPALEILFDALTTTITGCPRAHAEAPGDGTALYPGRDDGPKAAK